MERLFEQVAVVRLAWSISRDWKTLLCEKLTHPSSPSLELLLSGCRDCLTDGSRSHGDDAVG